MKLVRTIGKPFAFFIFVVFLLCTHSNLGSATQLQPGHLITPAEYLESLGYQLANPQSTTVQQKAISSKAALASATAATSPGVDIYYLTQLLGPQRLILNKINGTTGVSSVIFDPADSSPADFFIDTIQPGTLNVDENGNVYFARIYYKSDGQVTSYIYKNLEVIYTQVGGAFIGGLAASPTGDIFFETVDFQSIQKLSGTAVTTVYSAPILPAGAITQLMPQTLKVDKDGNFYVLRYTFIPPADPSNPFSFPILTSADVLKNGSVFFSAPLDIKADLAVYSNGILLFYTNSQDIMRRSPLGSIDTAFSVTPNFIVSNTLEADDQGNIYAVTQAPFTPQYSNIVRNGTVIFSVADQIHEIAIKKAVEDFTLPVPKLSQGIEPWATLIYDHRIKPEDTIGSLGCALTSVAMLLQYYGLSTEYDPEFVNDLLNFGYDGYTEDAVDQNKSGNIIWKAVSELANKESDGTVNIKFDSFIEGVNRVDAVKSQLRNKNPVILKVVGKKGKDHFIIAIGIGPDPSGNSTIKIHDPGNSSIRFLSENPYNGNFIDGRLFLPSAPNPLASLKSQLTTLADAATGSIYVYTSGAQFTITDSLGRKTGVDQNSHMFTEIPEATYESEETNDIEATDTKDHSAGRVYVFYTSQAIQGSYTINLHNEDGSPALLYISTNDSEGNINQLQKLYNISVGNQGFTYTFSSSINPIMLGALDIKKAEVEFGKTKDKLELKGHISTDANSNGYNPANEVVTLSVGNGNFVKTLMIGSFKKTKEGYIYKDKDDTEFFIGNQGSFEIELKDTSLDKVNFDAAVNIELYIGDDLFANEVTFKVKKHKDHKDSHRNKKNKSHHHMNMRNRGKQ